MLKAKIARFALPADHVNHDVELRALPGGHRSSTAHLEADAEAVLRSVASGVIAAASVAPENRATDQ